MNSSKLWAIRNSIMFDLDGYFLICYRCIDNGEIESCFLVKTMEKTFDFLDKKPSPPEGFLDRDGYYFFEPHEGPTPLNASETNFVC